ncbi:iron complex transport system substrate-binding protein [Pedobacter steynii]|uniref:Iron complex transport system substrate-binding protein n=1 Tax=Pedobacter steynii TaxID=430522 RepID=A0A1H0GQ24_9SPHI|nr:hypothetical protein [Pedobacter steynii]NQX42489.1 hypothetical protein [Pedobacter steynii]SDO09003.1 iron complex transport system substrate-binding protein [Pedobacter steynii]
MSFLKAVINKVENEVLSEELQERVDLIQHKIKFMEPVTVACLDTENHVNRDFEGIINDAGGVLQEDVNQARVLIYAEKDASMLEMMGLLPSLLTKEWPAVEYNRVYLLGDQATAAKEPQEFVALLEDIAEMLYPGYFVFGNEGKNWNSFGV